MPFAADCENGGTSFETLRSPRRPHSTEPGGEGRPRCRCSNAPRALPPRGRSPDAHRPRQRASRRRGPRRRTIRPRHRPRLAQGLPCVSDRMVDILSAQRLQVDASSKLTAAFTILVPVTATLLWRHGWRLLLTALCLVLARVSSRDAETTALRSTATYRHAPSRSPQRHNAVMQSVAPLVWHPSSSLLHSCGKIVFSHIDKFPHRHYIRTRR